VSGAVSVGVVCDYAEEGWPSMDLVAELTVRALRDHAPGFTPAALRPRLPRPFGRLRPGSAALHNADRYLGRYLVYPAWLRRTRGAHALHHVVDHSYAHLTHALPAGRAVVTCHDLDAFRSLLSPPDEPRPAWFRATMRHVLGGMRRAARVVCDSAAVRDEVLAHGLVDAARLCVLPLPAHPDFAPEPRCAADAEAARLLGPAAAGAPEVLHVGSTAPRKRIGLLLRAFAALRETCPGARLVRVGGVLEGADRALAEALGVRAALVELPPVDRPTLAAVYRRAAVVVLPSAREGFGLPVVEALACGAPVVAADLPVLREVGGPLVHYVPGDDPRVWAAALHAALESPADAEAARRREEAARWAARASPATYGAGLAEVYAEVLATAEGGA
jgi:glycosyltransferase involved in cell wall biosynthesis